MGICWFCNKKSEDQKTNKEVKLHFRIGSVTKGIPTASLKSVTYKTEKIIIPRCRECKAVLDRYSIMKAFAIFICGSASVSIGYITGIGFNNLISSKDSAFGVIVGVIVGLIVMFILAVLALLLIEKINPGQKSIVNDDYKKHPKVKRLLDSGWVIGERPSV